ncbi:uncharacterized protein LOC119104382 [Pollicipes pollicipes]|uniref:uncharacterized protein LOC119104382 n=1 Tax=Pollicipes pollicipes TaxID=41117 RepID=UPI001884E15B|nr:uncharacterized protein LOC119104382 [Pollicipes pollicipes]
MEAMDFDPEQLLTSTGSDPMLGKMADAAPVASGVEQPQAAPSGSFIVLKNAASPGVSGKVTQLGNISVSSLAPGQGSRAASSRLTAVMGRAAGSAPGALTKFIISPSQQGTTVVPCSVYCGRPHESSCLPVRCPGDGRRPLVRVLALAA